MTDKNPPSSASTKTAIADKEKMRQIIRDYYNHTFEYAMEQIEKGITVAVLADLAGAEEKQKALDEPYLARLEKIIEQALTAQRQQLEAATAELVRETLIKKLSELGSWSDSISAEYIRSIVEELKKDK